MQLIYLLIHFLQFKQVTALVILWMLLAIPGHRVQGLVHVAHIVDQQAQVEALA